MRGYRIRIALLALGAVVGYSSAFAQTMHARHHCHGHGGRDFGWGRDYDDDRAHEHEHHERPQTEPPKNGT
ncbi:MAG: hypothetical protein RL701_452 [Pseudomonadota bacterium]